MSREDGDENVLKVLQEAAADEERKLRAKGKML